MIWPWSAIARLRAERDWSYEAHARTLDEKARLYDDFLNMCVAMDRSEISKQTLMAENESLRAQLAAKIGMESAYNPDNPPPSVAATKRVRK